MEGMLHEAAIAGDAFELDRLVKEDPDILRGCGAAAEETPLHIAAQLGHTEFVAKIGILKPEFAHAKNSEGRCPLHLASAKGHVETVAKLLEINSDVCFVRDRDGRTPLHIAAMKGRIQVLEKLVEKKIKAAWVLADCGQPILHLCSNHNQFDALKLIIERVKDKAPEKLVEFVNLKDDDDNTILHLLAAKAEHQVIEFLFPEDQTKNVFKVNVNAINQQGSTALDVLHQNCGTLDRMRIKFLLDGAKRATDIPGSKSYEIKRSMWDSLFKRKEGEKSETRDALMVVAILIATVTFQAQINPPGGVWQQDGNINASHETYKADYYAGQSVMAFTDPTTYFWLTTFDTVGFVASLILILLLVSGFTLRRKVSTFALTLTTWIAVVSMFVIFGVSFFTLKSESTLDKVLKAPKAPPTPGMAPPTPGMAPPAPGMAPPMPGMAPPMPGMAPPAPGMAPPMPGMAPPAPGMAPPMPGMAPPAIYDSGDSGDSGSVEFSTSGFSLLVALMILLALLVLASGIKYIWMHLHKGIARSVKRGFKRLFCCPSFWKSSERDSEGRTDMNA